MHGYAGRLHQHRFFQTDLIVDLIHKIFADLEELAQRALRIRRPGGCGKSHLATQVVSTIFARGAKATRGAGLNGHAIAYRYTRYSGADTMYYTRCFVAHYYACARVDVFADAAVMPEVDLCVSGCCSCTCKLGIASGTYIAATYANICNADEHIMGICQIRHLFVFESCIFGTVKYYRKILHFSKLVQCKVQGD